MYEWNLKNGDPLSLTIATDARLVAPDYFDDQIWELKIGGGDPPALALQTTYGLRARNFRLFPRFTLSDTTLTDPATFSRPPQINKLCPNFIALLYSPFPNIDVESKYWVPTSKGVAGCMGVLNNSNSTQIIRIEWVALLTPTNGERMTAMQMQAAPVLSGITDGIAPIVFLTGGSKSGSGSYPSLVLEMEIQPGESRSFKWIQTALSNPESSFALVRKISNSRWDAEFTRLEMINNGLINIHTGNPDWDTALMLSQKQAYGLILGSSKQLPNHTFVTSRNPDQGYSLRGDGSDYDHLWNGQTPLDAYHLINIILPTAPNLAKGIIQNFLSVQEQNGFIDWKPGLAGQKSGLLATPILSTLTWQIYKNTEDKSFLENNFDNLLKFIRLWFSDDYDQDSDGIPEWKHTFQTGFDDHPIYSSWHEWSRGVDINTSENPGLCSLLFRECKAIIQIAELLNHDEPVEEFQSHLDNLQKAIEMSWDDNDAIYHDWDRDTHFCSKGKMIGKRTGPGIILINKGFESPIRVHILIKSKGETSRQPVIYIHGTSTSGNHRVERILSKHFKWHLGVGRMTGSSIYASIEQLEIQNINPNDQVQIFIAGYNNLNQTLFLPLWAGIPDASKAHVIIQRNIKNPDRFWRPYGIRACANPPSTPIANVCNSVHMRWNLMIGEGILNYGYRDIAADLISRILAGIVVNLKNEKSFRQYYHADSGEGIGERGALSGLAPLGFFLETLGVRLISSRKVALAGYNPFPWPVTVKYRGLSILRQKEKTMVTFPDGQIVNVSDPAPKIVSMRME
jgi:hypothetical protein